MTTETGNDASNPRTVLVTGGTGGIGFAIADVFAMDGCDVVVTGLEEEEVARVRMERPAWNVSRLDVCSTMQIDSLLGDLPRLDVLVNAAGTILRDGKEHDPDHFKKVVDVNLIGTMRVCTACRTKLATKQGSVINLASMLSFFGSGYVPAYSASKGGIVQLTRSLAIAWAADNIRVNAIAPGWIQTRMTEPLTTNQQRSREIVDRTPLGRWGRPADVAGAALFLSSPAASFITGAVLPVDGGYSIA